MTQILPPDMIPVKSSTLKAYAYRDADETLFVAFLGKNGKPDTLYRYKHFPKSSWDLFVAAGSKGEWHARYIRNSAAYPCERIG